MKRSLIVVAILAIMVVATIAISFIVFQRDYGQLRPLAYIQGPVDTEYGLFWNKYGDLWLSDRHDVADRIAATTDYYQDLSIADACWLTDTKLTVMTHAGNMFEISVDRGTFTVRRPEVSQSSHLTDWRAIGNVPSMPYRKRSVETPGTVSGTGEETPLQQGESVAEPRQNTSAAKPQTTPSIDELLLFFPSKYPTGDWSPADLTFEDLWCEAPDKTRIHGWYCPCDHPRATLLIAHGNAGNVATRAGWLRYLQANMRVAAYMFDYRGYGRSEGVPTVEGALQDARAARTALAKRAGIEESEMVLMGESLGGAIVVQLAAESAPRALILQSTFSSLKDVADVHYPRLSWLVPPAKLDSTAQIARFHGQLLQSHGTADRTIPFSLGEKLFRAANEPKTFVPIGGADHNDPPTDDYLRLLDSFLTGLGQDEKPTSDVP